LELVKEESHKIFVSPAHGPAIKIGITIHRFAVRAAFANDSSAHEFRCKYFIIGVEIHEIQSQFSRVVDSSFGKYLLLR
jgi:hypothetical protein